MPEIEVQSRDGWVEVILKRPERRNAITGPLGEALRQALQAASDDPNARVILLHGAGGAFCSGLDLKEFQGATAPDWLPRFPAIWRGVHRALFDCKKPVVVALERFAINAGAALALAADLLVAGEQSFLQIGEVQRGMAAPYNLAWLTLRYPEHISGQLALVGRRFSGTELHNFAIAYQVVPDDDVLTSAQALAVELAAYPAAALVNIKRGLRSGFEGDADAWFDRFVTI